MHPAVRHSIPRRPRGTHALVAACAIAGATLTLAPPLAAQGPGLFEMYAARKESSSEPLFGGASLSVYSGVFGMRIGGALNLARGDDTSFVAQDEVRCGRYGCRKVREYQNNHSSGTFGVVLRGWSADFDLILEPLRNTRWARILLLGFSPYGFAGIGAHAARPEYAPDTSAYPTLSYGAGVHHALIGWLGLGAEARYRRPMQNDTAYAGDWRHRLEYRVGLSVSFGGRSSKPAASEPAAAPPAVEATASVATAAEVVRQVLDSADSLIGKPYREGGAAPATGFDAAGFVQYVYGQAGVKLPRPARRMAEQGSEVSMRVGSLRPGDLLFFANEGKSIDHVAIYAGGERFVHSTASGGGVRYDVLGQGERGKWFADHLVAARRVVNGGRGRAPSGDRAPAPDDTGAPDAAPRPTPPA